MRAVVDQVYSLHLELLTRRNGVPEPLRYHVHHISSPQMSASPPSQSVFAADATASDLVPDNDSIFPSRYYVFHSAQHGALWLGYWCAHLHLLQTLGDALRRLAAPLALPADQAAMLARTLSGRLLAVVDGICASVPCLMGEIAKRRQSDSVPGGGSVRDVCPERQSTRASAAARAGNPSAEARGGPGVESRAKGNNNTLGSLFLLRALYVIIQVVPDLSGARRDYVLAALTRIGHVKGIALALRARGRWSGWRDVEMGRLPLVH